jgi:UDP-glucuronate decarboxylase
VVTGGAGFVGSHLCRKLIDQGHEVIAIDNFSTGSPENVRDLLSSPRFSLVERDVMIGLLDGVRKRIDRVYHLACPGSRVHYQRDPVNTVLTNVVGTEACLKLGARWGARCLLASAAQVYGDAEAHTPREANRGSVESTGPRACYEQGKRAAEALFFDYQRMNGLPIRIARIFNAYGPRMRVDDGRVVSNFVVQALRNQELTVFGDGQQVRSFCYIEDLIDGLIGLMERSPLAGPVNLGNPEAISVLELAELVIREVGRGRIGRRPRPEGAVQRRLPDIRAAQAAFDFRPAIPFKVGLRATIDYFERELGMGAPGAPERSGSPFSA